MILAYQANATTQRNKLDLIIANQYLELIVGEFLSKI